MVNLLIWGSLQAYAGPSRSELVAEPASTKEIWKRLVDQPTWLSRIVLVKLQRLTDLPRNRTIGRAVRLEMEKGLRPIMNDSVATLHLTAKACCGTWPVHKLSNECHSS